MKNNIAKGVNSKDEQIGELTVAFINQSSTEYAVTVGGPKFDLVPVTKQKDIMLNVGRMYAQQEYDRIMQLVEVLEKQAQDIRRRLEITDAVHAAEYQFQLVMGNCYWLVWSTRKEKTLLVLTGPTEWSTGKPIDYEYVAKVKYMGDHTWMEIVE